MRIASSVLDRISPTNPILNSDIPLEYFKVKIRAAVESNKVDDATLLLASSKLISQELMRTKFFETLVTEYLNEPKTKKHVQLLFGCLGGHGYITPFLRLAKIAADLSLDHLDALDGQIFLLSQHLEKERELPLAKYVQEHLERFQVEKRDEIARTLTYLQHYIHSEHPYQKKGYRQPLFILPDEWT